MNKLLVAIFLLTSTVGFSQLSYPLYNYLSEQKLQQEQEAFIKHYSSISTADTIHLLKAKYNFQYFNDSLFFDNYSKCQMLFISDSVELLKTSIQFLTHAQSSSKKWFDSFQSTPLTFSTYEVLSVYKASTSPLQMQATQLPVELQSVFLHYQKYAKKKGVIAGTLSMVVPGLGKLYTGRKKSFITTLLVNGLLAAQTTESIHKLGIEHPLSIFSLGVFSVFYFSNIYGSYYDVRTAQREQKTDFLLYATDYFNSTYATK
jgi:hypothetical protein